MIDDMMRKTKDVVLEPVVKLIGDNISPMAITLSAGAIGLIAALAGWQGSYTIGLVFWLGNRFLDGLDGAVARARGKQSDFGGYIDTLVDFAMYTIIPFGLVMHDPQMDRLIVLAFLFGTFYINAAAFLYLSAILERRNQGAKQGGELTSITMPRGIIEGTEAIIIFCLFFLLPKHLTLLLGILGILVIATTVQHIIWSMRNLN